MNFNWQLINDNISISLINCPHIKPLDKKIIDLINNFDKVLIVEDHKDFGSLFHRLKLLIFENGLNSKIYGKNLKNNFFQPLRYKNILEVEKFTPSDIKKVINLLNK